MNRYRPLVTAAATAASLAALISAAPAASADPLSLTTLGCDSDGFGNFSCDYQIFGGTGPYTGTTSSTSYAYPNSVVVYGNYAGVAGRCTYLHTYRLTLTIQDSTGAQASSTASGDCPKR